MQFTYIIIAFAAGAATGSLAYFIFTSRTKAQSSIERQLHELQEEFAAYRENVNGHFNKTADLVNKLTESYVAVQNHLEDAADSFSEPPKSFSLDNSAALPQKKTQFVSLEAKPKPLPQDDNADACFDEQQQNPPRDYATKSGTDEKGTLDEEYGLHEPKNQYSGPRN